MWDKDISVSPSYDVYAIIDACMKYISPAPTIIGNIIFLKLFKSVIFTQVVQSHNSFPLSYSLVR